MILSPSGPSSPQRPWYSPENLETWKQHFVLTACRDFVLPKPGAVPAVSERVLRSRDMGMMQLFNSLERDLEEWNSIFSAVDSRLKLNNVDQPWGSSMSVLDLVLSES